MKTIKKKEATGVLKSLIEWCESPEGQTELAKERDRALRIAEIEQSQIERFHSLTEEQREEFVKKVIRKYNSKEYGDRWWNRGIEPHTELYFFLHDYAKEYGTEIVDNTNPFPNSNYLFDGKWVASVIWGQGTVAHVVPLEWFTEWQNKMQKILDEGFDSN